MSNTGEKAPNALRELVLMRMRTFMREPEALFWTFGFPILLTIGLGLAFREEGEAPPIRIGIETGSIAETYMPALQQAGRLEPVTMDAAAAEHAIRTGEV